jgi:hypothetical protein
VELTGEAAVGLLDGSVVGIAGDAEQLAQDLGHWCASSQIRETYRARARTAAMDPG